jgi:hypothetical protein
MHILSEVLFPPVTILKNRTSIRKCTFGRYILAGSLLPYATNLQFFQMYTSEVIFGVEKIPPIFLLLRR